MVPVALMSMIRLALDPLHVRLPSTATISHLDVSPWRPQNSQVYPSLELLLRAQLVAVTALSLTAIGGTRWETGLYPALASALASCLHHPLLSKSYPGSGHVKPPTGSIYLSQTDPLIITKMQNSHNTSGR